MSALISLSSKLPGDVEINGLDSLHQQLVDNPEQVICAITWFDVPKITRNTEEDTEVPTVRIRKVEPIGVAEKVPAAVIQLYQELMEKRTGRSPLPFEQLDGRFDHVVESNANDAQD